MSDDERDRRSGDTGTNCGGPPPVDSHTPSVPVQQRGPEPLGRLAATGVGVVAMAPIVIVPTIVGVGWLAFAGSLLGGVVAGYLRGSNTTESSLTGGLAGFIAAIPGILLAGWLLYISGSVLIGDASSDSVDVGFALVVGLFLVAAVVLTIVVSAIGGAIGAQLTDREPP